MSGNEPKEEQNSNSFSLSDEVVDQKGKELEKTTNEYYKKVEFPDPPPLNFTKPDPKKYGGAPHDAEDHKSWGVGLTAGYGLIGPILLGWFIGYLFDSKTGGTIGRSLGVLFGMPVGLFGCIWILSRFNKDKNQ